MTSKKKLPPIVYIGATLLTGGICFTGYQAITGKQSGQLQEGKVYGNTSKQLRILGDTFSGYSTFRSDTFIDKITKQDLGIRYENEFDQKKRAKLLGNGADVIVTTLDQFLLNQPDGQIVGLIDKTVGADAVILNTKQFPSLKNLNDIKALKAKNPELKLVYSAGTPSEYLAKLLDIRFEGFKLADFQVVKVEESTEAYKLLQSDPSVAVAVLWEPFVSKAKNDGNTVTLSSRDIPDSIVDVIVASNKIINSRPDELKKFLTAYYEQNDGIVRNKSQLNAQITRDGNLSEIDGKNVANGIDFFSSVKTNKWMSKGILSQRIESTSAILNLIGNSTESIDDPKKLYTSQFIQDAVTRTKRMISAINATDPQLAKVLSGEKSSSFAVPSRQKIQTADSVGNLSVRGVVEFSTGSTILTQQGKSTLLSLVKEISDFSPDTTAINVVGHTSKTGSQAINQSLSEQRAQVVADYLKQGGVKLQIASQGRGFSDLLQGINSMDERNQRTEIQLKRIDK